MTTQLIPVLSGTISNETTLLVNARDLHEFLGVGKRFASWITERIAEYGFVKEQDYILISQPRETKGRGGDRRSKDYHLTLDTAKELAMVERNEKGREIRRYFIECEKKLTQRQQYTHPRQSVEPLDGNDMANLKYLINLITCRFTYKDAWNQGIWFALRRATGAPSPHPFSVEDIPVIAQECRRIMDVTSAASNLICQFEKDVLKHVIRNRKDFDAIASKMQNDFQQLQIPMEGMQKLERFEELSLMRLERRAH